MVKQKISNQELLTLSKMEIYLELNNTDIIMKIRKNKNSQPASSNEEPISPVSIENDIINAPTQVNPNNGFRKRVNPPPKVVPSSEKQDIINAATQIADNKRLNNIREQEKPSPESLRVNMGPPIPSSNPRREEDKEESKDDIIEQPTLVMPNRLKANNIKNRKVQFEEPSPKGKYKLFISHIHSLYLVPEEEEKQHLKPKENLKPITATNAPTQLVAAPLEKKPQPVVKSDKLAFTEKDIDAPTQLVEDPFSKEPKQRQHREGDMDGKWLLSNSVDKIFFFNYSNIDLLDAIMKNSKPINTPQNADNLPNNEVEVSGNPF